MNQKPADSFDGIAAQPDLIPFSEIPGQSTLFLDFQLDSQLIDNFYPEKHTPLREFAEKVLSNYTVDRETLCDTLLKINKESGARIKTFINIEMLRRKDCLAVVAAGDAGLFTGPLETIYKVLSAVKLARELREQQITAVPVFWITDEEHDFEQVNRTYVLGKEQKVIEIQEAPHDHPGNLPVGYVRFDSAIDETIDQLISELKDTDFTQDIKSLLKQCYQSGESYSSAFGKMLMKLFSDYGLIVLSPLDTRLKQLSSPVVTRAVERSDDIVAGVQRIGRILKGENYQAEILVEENSFPFFLQNEGGERRALVKDPVSGRIKVQDSSADFEKSELVRIARSKSEFLSANAVVRPVVQDFLLPTIAFFGSSSEIACFAQSAVVYEILNRPATPVRHHASCTIIEPRFTDQGLQFRDLLSGKENFIAQLAAGSAANAADELFAEVQQIVDSQMLRLNQHLARSGSDLADQVADRKHEFAAQLGMLKEKNGRSAAAEIQASRQLADDIFTALFPYNSLQERALNIVTFLNLFGPNFIKVLYDSLETDENRHKVLYMRGGGNEHSGESINRDEK